MEPMAFGFGAAAEVLDAGSRSPSGTLLPFLFGGSPY